MTVFLATVDSRETRPLPFIQSIPKPHSTSTPHRRDRVPALEWDRNVMLAAARGAPTGTESTERRLPSE